MLNIVSSSRYKINRDLIQKTVADVLLAYGIPDNAIFNLVFIGKKKMKDISAKYKNEDVALPVLSFSYQDKKNSGEGIYGEIIICYPQAILLAAERQKTVDKVMIGLIKHGLENILK